MASLSDNKTKEIIQKWVGLFVQNDSKTFAAMCTPKAVYHDHAFQVTRVGQISIKKHFEIWLHTNPDFSMEIEHFQKTENGASIRFVSRGTFKNSIADVKATGGTFEYRGVLDFVLDNAGQIEQIDEYYSKTWYQGVELKKYNFEELV